MPQVEVDNHETSASLQENRINTTRSKSLTDSETSSTGRQWHLVPVLSPACEEEESTKEPPTIVDTALRDDEQTAEVVFANEKKTQMPSTSCRVGVPQIEAGVPDMGGDEQWSIVDIVRLDLPCSIMAWNRAVVDDASCSLDCGVDALRDNQWHA